MSRAIATLGDSALLLPASALLLLYMLALRQGRLALAFGLALGLAGAATIALKLAFHACGHALPGPEVMSPSGHVSFSTIFYGALAAMLAAGRPRATQRLIAAGTALLILLIGASRVRTQAHTVAEVAIGLAIGLSALAIFWRLHARIGRPGLPPLPLAIGFAAALLLLGGAHFSLEGRIGRIARDLTTTFDVCDDIDPGRRGWRWRQYGLKLPTSSS